MRQTVRRNCIGLALTAVLLLTTIAPGPATTLVLNTTAGPYDIRIGSSPTPLVVGQNHISILVQDHADGRVVTDAEIMVTASTLEATDAGGNGTSFRRTATHEQAADERQYGAALTFDTPGRWQLAIDIDGPAGVATTNVQLTVQRDVPGLPLIYFMMILIPLTAAALMVHWLRSDDA